MGNGFRVVVAALLMVAVVGPTHAGVTRDVPLLYQTLGTRNIPLTVPGANSSTSLKGAAFDGLRVWVGDYTAGMVYGINIYSNQVVSQVQLSTRIAGIAFDGTYVWAVGTESSGAYRFDPNNPPTKTLSPIVTDSRIRGWGVAFDGRYLWTSGIDSTGAGPLLAIAIDTTTNPPAVAAAIPSTISWGAVGAVFDGHYIWMADQAGLIKIDPATMTIVFSTTTITGSGGVNFLATDGAYLWLLGGGTVQQINPQTNSIVATVPVTAPWGIAFDGTFLWVGTNSTTAGAVTRIDVRNATISESHSFPSGFNPYNVVYDGTHTWIIGGAGSTPAGSIWKILVRGN